MRSPGIVAILFFFFLLRPAAPSQAATGKDVGGDTTLMVTRCNDFPVTGDGGDAEWNKAGWHSLTKLDAAGPEYSGRFKIMYSDSGIYVLFAGQDRRISSTDMADMDEIYEGDAFEVFLLPDTARMIYFEYEINPLGKQLVLTLAGSGRRRAAWVPWNKSPVRISHQVRVAGGEMKPGAAITGWSAELFFPYAMLHLISGAAPKSGQLWRANLCRLDYDAGPDPVKWSWSPGIRKSFHELNQFRALRFE